MHRGRIRAMPGRRLDPARLAEAAARFCDAIMGKEELRICALEGHHLERRLGLDPFHQVVDLVVHAIIDGVDGRMIERHPPTARRRLVYRHPGMRFDHCLASPTSNRRATALRAGQSRRAGEIEQLPGNCQAASDRLELFLVNGRVSPLHSVSTTLRRRRVSPSQRMTERSMTWAKRRTSRPGRAHRRELA